MFSCAMKFSITGRMSSERAPAETVNRLVVVSNRVTPVSDSKATTAGGLAVGLLAALRESGGIWFGWSGQIADDR